MITRRRFLRIFAGAVAGGAVAAVIPAAVGKISLDTAVKTLRYGDMGNLMTSFYSHRLLSHAIPIRLTRAKPLV